MYACMYACMHACVYACMLCVYITEIDIYIYTVCCFPFYTSSPAVHEEVGWPPEMIKRLES